MEKVPQSGYPIEGLWISGLQRRVTADNLSFPMKLLSSLRKAGKIIRRFKPDAAVGVGGYASGPLLYRAAAKNIPCLIQEQNSYPGITNKLLARRVNKICVAHDKMNRFFPAEKLVFTGNPVRKDIIDLENKKQQALDFFKLEKEKPVLFIMGGSLGARTINESILAGVDQLLAAGMQLIWQTGRVYFEDIKKQLTDEQMKNIRLYEFLREMDLAYAAAEVVISRAGALSVSELALARQPVIFVPSPNVTEDHQTKNAMALVEKGAAWIVADKDSRQQLALEALRLLNDREEQKNLKKNIAALAKPNAATEIVEEIIKLIEN